MNKRHFPITLEQDKNGYFIASCPTFQGCHSYGVSIDEAITNITEAIEVCLEEDTGYDDTKFIGVRDIEIAV